MKHGETEYFGEYAFKLFEEGDTLYFDIAAPLEDVKDISSWRVNWTTDLVGEITFSKQEERLSISHINNMQFYDSDDAANFGRFLEHLFKESVDFVSKGKKDQ